MPSKKSENHQLIQQIKAGVQGQDVPRLFYFACFVAQGMTPYKAKIKAGYSKNYDTTELLKASKTQKYLKNIVESRELLQSTPGFTMIDSALFNKEIRDNKKENTQERQRSDGALSKMLGYNAPIEINKEERVLSIALDGMDIKELYEMQQALSPV